MWEEGVCADPTKVGRGRHNAHPLLYLGETIISFALHDLV